MNSVKGGGDGKGLSRKVYVSLIVCALLLSSVFVYYYGIGSSDNETSYEIAWMRNFGGDSDSIDSISWSPNSELVSINKPSHYGYNGIIIMNNSGTELETNLFANLSVPNWFTVSEWFSNSEMFVGRYDGTVLFKINITTGESTYVRQPVHLDFSHSYLSYNADKGYLAMRPTYHGNSITDSNIYYNGSEPLRGPVEIINASTFLTKSIINIKPEFNETSGIFEISPSGERIAIIVGNGIAIAITEISDIIDNLDSDTTSHSYVVIEDPLRRIRNIAWSPDDSKIATTYREVSGDNSNPTSNLTIWDSKNGDKIRDIVLKDAHWLVSLEWNVDDAIITTAESREAKLLNTIYILNGTDLSFVQNISRHNLNVGDLRSTRGDVETSPSGQYIAVSFGQTVVMLEKASPDANTAILNSGMAILAPLGTLILLRFSGRKRRVERYEKQQK